MKAIRYFLDGTTIITRFPLPDQGDCKMCLGQVAQSARLGRVYFDTDMVRTEVPRGSRYDKQLVTAAPTNPFSRHAGEIRAAVQSQPLVFCQVQLVGDRIDGNPVTIRFADGWQVELPANATHLESLYAHGGVYGRPEALVARVKTRAGIFLVSPWMWNEPDGVKEYPLVLLQDPLPLDSFTKVEEPTYINGEDWNYTPTQVGRMAQQKDFPASWQGYTLGTSSTFGTEFGAWHEQPCVRFMFREDETMMVIHPDGTHARLPQPVWTRWVDEGIIPQKRGLVATFEGGKFTPYNKE